MESWLSRGSDTVARRARDLPRLFPMGTLQAKPQALNTMGVWRPEGGPRHPRPVADHRMVQLSVPLLPAVWTAV